MEHWDRSWIFESLLTKHVDRKPNFGVKGFEATELQLTPFPTIHDHRQPVRACRQTCRAEHRLRRVGPAEQHPFLLSPTLSLQQRMS